MLDFEEELKKFQPSLEDEAGRSTVNCGKEKRLQFTGKNSGMESLSAV